MLGGAWGFRAGGTQRGTEKGRGEQGRKRQRQHSWDAQEEVAFRVSLVQLKGAGSGERVFQKGKPPERKQGTTECARCVWESPQCTSLETGMDSV